MHVHFSDGFSVDGDVFADKLIDRVLQSYGPETATRLVDGLVEKVTEATYRAYVAPLCFAIDVLARFGGLTADSLEAEVVNRAAKSGAQFSSGALARLVELLEDAEVINLSAIAGSGEYLLQYSPEAAKNRILALAGNPRD